MQWQHGSYSLEPNGSLVLTPIPSDGRQLSSNPCVGNSAAYTRYNQTETFKVIVLVLFSTYLSVNALFYRATMFTPMHSTMLFV
jgi:hypothetical protein